jgi:hypothetical protein
MMRWFAFVCVAVSAALGCGSPEGDATRAPATLRGQIVVEPPRISIGDVASVEVIVVTPPDHQVRPIRPPQEVPGFWLLDAEPLAVRRSASRWVHATRIRARARKTGQFAWPSMRVEIEKPDLTLTAIELDERPLEVVSVEPEFPDRTTPFPLRPAPQDAPPPGLLVPVAAGAVLALLGVALAGLVRRHRFRRAADRFEASQRGALAPPAWRSAQATLEAAMQLAGEDPQRAAGDGAAALRHFVAHRFGVAAPSSTTEELRARTPPLGAERHWPTLIEILSDLDDLRFRPLAEATGGEERLRSCLVRAQRFVAEAAPELRWR